MKSPLFLLVLLTIHIIYSNCLNPIRKGSAISQIQKSLLTNLDEYTNSTVVIHHFYIAELQNCNIKTCLPKFGVCDSKTSCVCNEGYANVPQITQDFACGYKQKKQIVTFFLEMFILGAGHIYRGSIIIGVLKMLFVLLFPCLLLVLVFMGIIVESDIKSQTCFLVSSIAVSFFYLITVLIWYIYDLVNIGRNDYTDGNGVPLKPW